MATGKKETAVGTKRNANRTDKGKTPGFIKRASASAKGAPVTESQQINLRSDKDVAISTELAPAVAIALLEQADHGHGQAAPALEPLAAGAVSSDAEGKVRVQLLFENGAVLPVEMTDAAAQALGKGIAKELQRS
jgi:hypothetical protein